MNKKINIGILAIMFIILSLSLISAVTTINTPAASTTLSSCGGLQTFNVTSTDIQNGQGNGGSIINLTFYAQSTLTANSSWATIGSNNSLNFTLLANHTITSLNLTGLLEDANNYIINVTLKNATGGQILGQDTNTGMTIDCTVPTAPTGLTPTSDTTGTNVAFSSTVTGSQTTSCTLFFIGINPGSSSYTMTHSGNTCTYTLATAPEQTYQYYVRASDESNTTNSATQTLNVDVTTSAGKAAALIASGQAKSTGGAGFSVVDGEIIGGVSNITLFLVVIGIVIFIVVLVKLRN